MSELTDRIDKLIRAKGITKSKFYADIGISSMTYSKWARDINQPRSENMKMIASYFNVSLSYLMFGTEDDQTEKKTAAPASGDLTDAQIELLKITRLLDDDAVRYLTAKARDLEEFRRFRDSQ